MSSVEFDQVKQAFCNSYKIIDNMQSTGFWYCRCHDFFGCQTILSFLKNDKRYCFVCQFKDELSLFELRNIKKFGFTHYLRHYHKKILDRIE